MLLNVIFIHCISFAAANYDFLSDTFLRDFSLNESQTAFRRITGQTVKKNDYESNAPTCDQMCRTSRTPFVCLLLYRTSGRFVGMGSIIDKRTVLTAARVVEHSLHTPGDLLVLAGRLSPWWGKHSQVKKASEVYQNELGLAIVKLKEPLVFNPDISPIKLPLKDTKTLEKDYDKHYAVFGIPRSSWDIPGESVPKTSIYLMKVETLLQKKEDLDPCKAAFPDSDYNDTVNFCTTANGTFCWGCIGSPTVAVSKNDKVLQIAVITKTTTSEKDVYHIHTKVAPFDQWLRSHSLINFKSDK